MVTRPSPHFTWAELGATDAPPEARAALELLCVEVLEPLRAWIGRPVRVTSGYRSHASNAAIPGASGTSQHTRGEAADLVVDGLTSRELCRALVASGARWDQVIWYDAPDSHLHVSFTRRHPLRRELRHAVGGSYPLEAP